MYHRSRGQRKMERAKRVIAPPIPVESAMGRNRSSGVSAILEMLRLGYLLTYGSLD